MELVRKKISNRIHNNVDMKTWNKVYRSFSVGRSDVSEYLWGYVEENLERPITTVIQKHFSRDKG